MRAVASRDEHDPAALRELGQQPGAGAPLELDPDPSHLAPRGDRRVDAGLVLIGMRADRQAHHEITLRAADIAAIQQRREQCLPGGFLVADLSLTFLEVAAARRRRDLLQVARDEQPEFQSARGIGWRDRIAEEVKADRGSQVVAGDDGLERDALLRSPGGGLADARQVGGAGQLTGTQCLDEAADRVLDDSHDLAAQLLLRHVAVAGQISDELLDNAR